MASEDEERLEEDNNQNGNTAQHGHTGHAPSTTSEAEHTDQDEDEDEDEAEPNLKYTKLSGSLTSVYRNGDSTSTFVVAGDKMIIGTHNGNVHVLSNSSFQNQRVYHAHSASITSISVSPYKPTIPAAHAELSAAKTGTADQRSPVKTPKTRAATSSPQTPNTPQLPSIPSNSIYIASASIDGHVCVSSLVDSKDVTLRNFGRPVQAVALSPEFKADRTYLSGGLAGNLILTVGGRPGVSTDANTNSAAAAASSWLGTIGLGSNTGRDTILHSGEGNISNISWSLTGKFVAWVNEKGIKIMRSHLHLGQQETELAWKRLGHLDLSRPNRRSWEDMAGSWKARAQWVNERYLETPEPTLVQKGLSISETSSDVGTISIAGQNPGSPRKPTSKTPNEKPEKLIVGWGDTIWIVRVISVSSKPELLHKFRFDDCIVSGLSLYTPSLLLLLAYRTRDDDDKPIALPHERTPKRGIPRRQNGLPPDLRLINLDSTEDDKVVEVEGLHISRHEELSAFDYHLSTIYAPAASIPSPAQRRTFEAISNGLWDIGRNTTRLFSSGASILSGSSDDKTVSVDQSSNFRGLTLNGITKPPSPALSKSGLKIFIHSPYDCVLAIKRDMTDRLDWFLGHEQYKEAWELIDSNPEILSSESSNDSRPTTPSKIKEESNDFFEDDASIQSESNRLRSLNSTAEKEKRRVGDLWVQQLATLGDWVSAGSTAGRVLNDSSRWEHWIWTFAHANKFDEISPYMPTKRLKPPISSLAYERVLGHYIIHDRVRFQELVQQWDTNIFDNASVAASIESFLGSGEVRKDTSEDGVQGRDWHVLLDSLAKLYLADSRPSQALKCYIRAENADTALDLVREYQLLEVVGNDIYNFATIRVTDEQISSPLVGLKDLELLSAEPIRLLVDGAVQGIIPVDTVISQFEALAPKSRPFLFFYVQALWLGSSTKSSTQPRKIRRRFDAAASAADSQSKALLAPYGDLVVTLFAEYSRPLLTDFLKTSTIYTPEHASAECESRHFIPELVNLLSATGQIHEALHLIIDEIGEAPRAIAFCKEVDDDGLWEDLLKSSMDKPHFVRSLLEDSGVNINPVELVRRIPEGLEIEGLKGALGTILRAADIQVSISEGAERVLRSEVTTHMNKLRRGRQRGLVFDEAHAVTDDFIVKKSETEEDRNRNNTENTTGDTTCMKPKSNHIQRGRCALCGRAYTQAPPTIAPSEIIESPGPLLGFQCAHIFHLSCLLEDMRSIENERQVDALYHDLASPELEEQGEIRRHRIGLKVARARMIGSVLGEQSCVICRDHEVQDA